MKINASEIRVGMLLEYKNDLWQVLKTQHVKPGKGGAFAQVEMKSVGKSTKLNERFRSSDTVEKASLEEVSFNYLYDYCECSQFLHSQDEHDPPFEQWQACPQFLHIAIKHRQLMYLPQMILQRILPFQHFRHLLYRLLYHHFYQWFVRR